MQRIEVESILHEVRSEVGNVQKSLSHTCENRGGGCKNRRTCDMGAIAIFSKNLIKYFYASNDGSKKGAVTEN